MFYDGKTLYRRKLPLSIVEGIDEITIHIFSATCKIFFLYFFASRKLADVWRGAENLEQERQQHADAKRAARKDRDVARQAGAAPVLPTDAACPVCGFVARARIGLLGAHAETSRKISQTGRFDLLAYEDQPMMMMMMMMMKNFFMLIPICLLSDEFLSFVLVSKIEFLPTIIFFANIY